MSSTADFGMDTTSLGGGLEIRLRAIREAGFGQVMLSARDLVQHHGGVQEAIAIVRDSGLRVTGLQVLRDFEGLSGHLHDHKVDVAKSLLDMCAALHCRVLRASSSTSQHASTDHDVVVKDLRKLAMLAVPLGIKVAYEGLPWGRTVNDYATAWDLVEQADCPNLGLGIDAFHVVASQTPLDALELIDPGKIFMVQLADFMGNEVRTVEERKYMAEHGRVFPGEGVHSALLAELVLKLDQMGYAGDHSFAVLNDDDQATPPEQVAQRAMRSATWLADDVLQRATPLPSQMRLKRA